MRASVRSRSRKAGRGLRLALLGLVACALAPAHADDLDVIQYNVQFVAPWDFSRASPKHYPNTEERAREIGRALACYDIVALNETINDRRRRQILAAMEAAAAACGKPSRFAGGHSFQLLAGPSLPSAAQGWPSLAALAAFATSDTPMAVTDDEVAIVTRLPIVASGSHIYARARGTDALTTKGVLHARLRRAGAAPRSAAARSPSWPPSSKRAPTPRCRPCCSATSTSTAPRRRATIRRASTKG